MSYQRVHRMIFGLDIAGFESLVRDDGARMRMRSVLYDAVEDALNAASIGPADHDLLDRGDGLVLVIRPVIAVQAVHDLLIPTFRVRIAEHNCTAQPAGRMGVRAVLHAGEVIMDGRGYIGPAVNLTFRILDSEALRTRLAATDADLVLAVSETVWHDLISTDLPGAAFEEVSVQCKETRARVWIDAPAFIRLGS